MNAEENGQIARLTTNAVNHPSDATVDNILKLIEEAEQRAVHVREVGERIISEFRKHASILSDHVNDHFIRCQKVTEALQEIRVQVFGEETKAPTPRVDTVDRVATAAVVNAMLDRGKRTGGLNAVLHRDTDLAEERRRVLDSLRVGSYEEAKAVAKAMAMEAFREQVTDEYDYQLGLAPMLINDFGEFTTIRATIFGEMAQVREGCFTIGEENVPRRTIRRR